LGNHRYACSSNMGCKVQYVWGNRWVGHHRTGRRVLLKPCQWC
jgi:hypothetical protein